jgi:hypothetical protein
MIDGMVWEGQQQPATSAAAPASSPSSPSTQVYQVHQMHQAGARLALPSAAFLPSISFGQQHAAQQLATHPCTAQQELHTQWRQQRLLLRRQQ